MKDLLRLAGFLRPYMRRMVGAALMLAISGLLMAVAISTVKPLVNRVFVPAIAPAAASESVNSSKDIVTMVRDWLPVERLGDWGEKNYLLVPLILIGIFVIRGMFQYLGQYNTIRCGASVIRDLRAALFESVTFQSLRFHQDHSSGVILSRVLTDVARLQETSTVLLADLIKVSVLIPAVLFAAFLHEWRVALLAFIVMPVLGYPMVRLGRRILRAATTSQMEMAVVTERVKESIDGIRIVQGFGKEQFEIGRFRAAVDRMLRADLRAARAAALSPAIMELIGAMVGAGLFYLAGHYIGTGEIDAGSFAAVLMYLGLLFISIRKLNRIYGQLQVSRSAAARVFSMLDAERAIADLPGATELPGFERSIRFENVHFTYGDDPVLNGIDLEIPKGQRLALVGASGSGKTTLANLLPRFYDATDGRVTIDDHDVRGVTVRSLRNQIGIVTQETVLFDDTVYNNIAYGDSDIPKKRVREAARAAYAEEFIESLPNGYDTRLGERGARLSMGQRQRLTIARALLKDPPILILDEATSALDAESESVVQEALERLLAGRTSLVIAHRFSTVRGADRILVMQKGRIVEQGSHHELLQRGGVYSRLYELQFRDEA